jgi:hypothetical protein
VLLRRSDVLGDPDPLAAPIFLKLAFIDNDTHARTVRTHAHTRTITHNITAHHYAPHHAISKRHCVGSHQQQREHR